MSALHSSFDDAERARYARQLVLPDVGPDGQAAIRRGSVLIIGAGGTGSPLLLYLAAAGVGRITIMDPGRVDLPDLQRQILYTQGDLGRPKPEAAAERLVALGAGTTVEPVAAAFTPAGARERVRAHDVVVDASDNPTTRYLVSDACVLERRPLVFGAVSRLEGQVARLAGDDDPCYRCLYPDPPEPGSVPTCAEEGVLGPAAGVVGSLMALEVLRALGALARPPRPPGLLHMDLGSGAGQRVDVPRRADCAACGNEPTVRDVAIRAGAGLAGDPYPGP